MIGSPRKYEDEVILELTQRMLARGELVWIVLDGQPALELTEKGRRAGFARQVGCAKLTIRASNKEHS